MKEKYITITGMNHYYGLKPFSVGKRVKCIKEPSNPFDSEAIKVTMKGIGTVGYVANSSFTGATGTMSAGRIYEKVKKKFVVEVMFITSSKVICKVVDGLKATVKDSKDITRQIPKQWLKCLRKRPLILMLLLIITNQKWRTNDIRFIWGNV